MREIKFRYVFQHDETGRIYTKEYDIEELEGNDGFQIERGYSIVARLQYTGLKDKNGVEIYESDIVADNGFIGVVYCNNNECCYAVKSKYDDEDEAWMSKTCEVIGNIYENKELLDA